MLEHDRQQAGWSVALTGKSPSHVPDLGEAIPNRRFYPHSSG
jgi:hypothetical protein